MSRKRGKGPRLPMPETETESNVADGVSSDLWTEIESDVTALFGDDVDIRVDEFEDHIDVRIMPNGAVSKLEKEHEDLTIVPYNACQMTVRKADETAETEPAED